MNSICFLLGSQLLDSTTCCNSFYYMFKYLYHKNILNIIKYTTMKDMSSSDEDTIKKCKIVVLCISQIDYSYYNFENNMTYFFNLIDKIKLINPNIHTCVSKFDFWYNCKYEKDWFVFLFKKFDKIVTSCSYDTFNIFYKDIFNKNTICNVMNNIATDKFLLNFNKNPINRLLLHFNYNDPYAHHLYPYRSFIYNLNNENIDVKTFKPNMIDDCFHTQLNEYLCVITTSVTSNCCVDNDLYTSHSLQFLVAKVFEITCVGSLLLIDDTDEYLLNKFGFFNNINCLMFNKNNILDKINYILDPINITIINKIRKNGQNLTRSKYTSFNFYEQIYKIINAFDY